MRGRFLERGGATRPAQRFTMKLMRRWAGVGLVCIGCTAPNPAFQATTTGDGSASAASTSAATTTGSSSPTTTGIETTGPLTSTTSTTSTTQSSTTSAGETTTTSTTGAPARCGDGELDPGEACDGGPEPPLEPGACRPDCAGLIEARTIFVTKEPSTGNFAANADLSVADGLCMDAADVYGLTGGYRALISDVTRRGAIEAHDGDCSADWPLQPFTAYKNRQGDLVWVTGEVRLLGVVPGATRGEPNLPAPLLAPIDAEPLLMWTGLASTWQTAATCDNWIGGAQDVGTVGRSSLLVGFLDDGKEELCAADYHLVCVEQ